MMFFFFSSRRRHTRFDCDWSSDVCSSDLLQIDRLSPFQPRGTDVAVILDLMIHDLDLVLELVRAPVTDVRATGVAILTRSEEHTSELQSQSNLVCRLLLEKKKITEPMRDADYLSLGCLDWLSLPRQIARERITEWTLDDEADADRILLCVRWHALITSD